MLAGGEADNELLARRSTAARSANPKHSFRAANSQALMECGNAGALCRAVPLQFPRQETLNANATPCHDADCEQRFRVARGTLRCHLSAAEHCRGTGRREGAPVSKFETGARSEGIGCGFAAVRYSKAHRARGLDFNA